MAIHVSYRQHADLQNHRFEASSKSLRYHITQTALWILSALGCLAHLVTYVFAPYPSDAENFSNKHIWDPIGKMFDENKNKEIKSLGLDRIPIFIPMQQL
ncbi:MAG: hypothetical protein EBS28_01075 [Chlamydiae bacterium]|nr:hypothetical protein [Chlamydiota bacterium]